MKIDFEKQNQAPEMESQIIESADFIDRPGKYTFRITKAELTSSGVNADGSEKSYLDEHGQPLKYKPKYEDRTELIKLVLQAVENGKIHIHYMATAAYAKMKSFSAADIKDNGLVASDDRDKYAMFKSKKDGKYYRIFMKAGTKEADGVAQIFSRFTTAIGMPEGTKKTDCPEFVGRYFSGKIEENQYTANDGSEGVKRLKLAPSFYKVSEEALAALETAEPVEQEFS